MIKAKTPLDKVAVLNLGFYLFIKKSRKKSFQKRKKNILKIFINYNRVSKISREVAALGREMMGGNGIYFDNYSIYKLKFNQ